MSTPGIFDVDSDESGVGHIAQSTLVGGNRLGIVEGFLHVWLPDRNIEVLQVEGGVCIAPHHLVGPHDLLDLHVDEVVERIDVLLDETLHLQKGREELPLVPDGVDGFGEVFAVSEEAVGKDGSVKAVCVGR